MADEVDINECGADFWAYSGVIDHRLERFLWHLEDEPKKDVISEIVVEFSFEELEYAREKLFVLAKQKVRENPDGADEKTCDGGNTRPVKKTFQIPWIMIKRRVANLLGQDVCDVYLYLTGAERDFPTKILKRQVLTPTQRDPDVMDAIQECDEKTSPIAVCKTRAELNRTGEKDRKVKVTLEKECVNSEMSDNQVQSLREDVKDTVMAAAPVVTTSILVTDMPKEEGCPANGNPTSPLKQILQEKRKCTDDNDIKPVSSVLQPPSGPVSDNCDNSNVDLASETEPVLSKRQTPWIENDGQTLGGNLNYFMLVPDNYVLCNVEKDGEEFMILAPGPDVAKLTEAKSIADPLPVVHLNDKYVPPSVLEMNDTDVIQTTSTGNVDSSVKKSVSKTSDNDIPNKVDATSPEYNHEISTCERSIPLCSTPTKSNTMVPSVDIVEKFGSECKHDDKKLLVCEPSSTFNLFCEPPTPMSPKNKLQTRYDDNVSMYPSENGINCVENSQYDIDWASVPEQEMFRVVQLESPSDEHCDPKPVVMQNSPNQLMQIKLPEDLPASVVPPSASISCQEEKAANISSLSQDSLLREIQELHDRVFSNSSPSRQPTAGNPLAPKAVDMATQTDPNSLPDLPVLKSEYDGQIDYMEKAITDHERRVRTGEIRRDKCDRRVDKMDADYFNMITSLKATQDMLVTEVQEHRKTIEYLLQCRCCAKDCPCDDPAKLMPTQKSCTPREIAFAKMFPELFPGDSDAGKQIGKKTVQVEKARTETPNRKGVADNARGTRGENGSASAIEKKDSSYACFMREAKRVIPPTAPKRNERNRDEGTLPTHSPMPDIEKDEAPASNTPPLDDNSSEPDTVSADHGTPLRPSGKHDDSTLSPVDFPPFPVRPIHHPVTGMRQMASTPLVPNPTANDSWVDDDDEVSKTIEVFLADMKKNGDNNDFNTGQRVGLNRARPSATTQNTANTGQRSVPDRARSSASSQNDINTGQRAGPDRAPPSVHRQSTTNTGQRVGPDRARPSMSTQKESNTGQRVGPDRARPSATPQSASNSGQRVGPERALPSDTTEQYQNSGDNASKTIQSSGPDISRYNPNFQQSKSGATAQMAPAPTTNPRQQGNVDLQSGNGGARPKDMKLGEFSSNRTENTQVFPNNGNQGKRIVTRNGWHPPERERKRKRTQSSSKTYPPLSAVESSLYKDVFVRGLRAEGYESKEMLEDAIIDYCDERGVDLYHIWIMTNTGEPDMANAKVTVASKDTRTVMVNSFWPGCATVREWYQNPKDANGKNVNGHQKQKFNG